jgi:hypothetical protein
MASSFSSRIPKCPTATIGQANAGPEALLILPIPQVNVESVVNKNPVTHLMHSLRPLRPFAPLRHGREAITPGAH